MGHSWEVQAQLPPKPPPAAPTLGPSVTCPDSRFHGGVTSCSQSVRLHPSVHTHRAPEPLCARYLPEAAGLEQPREASCAQTKSCLAAGWWNLQCLARPGPATGAGSLRAGPFRDHVHLPRRQMWVLPPRGLICETCFWSPRLVFQIPSTGSDGQSPGASETSSLGATGGEPGVPRRREEGCF